MKLHSDEIETSTRVVCPGCYRLICKCVDVEGVNYVEYKNKGSRGVYFMARDAIISCMGCQRRYFIEGNKGLVKEVNLG